MLCCVVCDSPCTFFSRSVRFQAVRPRRRRKERWWCRLVLATPRRPPHTCTAPCPPRLVHLVLCHEHVPSLPHLPPPFFHLASPLLRRRARLPCACVPLASRPCLNSPPPPSLALLPCRTEVHGCCPTQEWVKRPAHGATRTRTSSNYSCVCVSHPYTRLCQPTTRKQREDQIEFEWRAASGECRHAMTRDSPRRPKGGRLGRARCDHLPVQGVQPSLNVRTDTHSRTHALRQCRRVRHPRKVCVCMCVRASRRHPFPQTHPSRMYRASAAAVSTNSTPPSLHPLLLHRRPLPPSATPTQRVVSPFPNIKHVCALMCVCVHAARR